MSSIRYYLPLVGFVVPTVVIGYGFVIPCSPIAGVNQLTIGFGSTILGAILTYVAGIRMALRPACPATPPWRRKLAGYVNRQAACPSGVFGRVLGMLWTIEHRRVNRTTLNLLGIRDGDRVLEVGCGPGWAVREAATRANHVHVMGTDTSETMVRVARGRNRRAIRNGQVSIEWVRDGDSSHEPATFDRAFSVHCLYFWKDPAETLRQLAGVLRPGGRLLLAFLPEGPDVATRFRGGVHRFYSPGELRSMLEAVGFAESAVVRGPDDGETMVWIAATKPGTTEPRLRP